MKALRDPARRPELQAAVADLERLTRRDPTNPWYDYFRGLYLDCLDRRDEALSAYRAALAHDPAYDYELLAMSSRLAEVDQELSEQARPYVFFGPMGEDVTYVGYWLNAFMALVIAMLILLFVKILRTFSARFDHPRPAPWSLNPLSRWTRGELVGYMAAFGLCLWMSLRIATGIATIGVVAGAPLNITMGNLGHPASVDYFRDLEGMEGEAPPAGALFIQALSLQQAGELDKAAQIYAGLTSPRAKVNLGAIRTAQGKPEEAKKLWTQALEKTPHLAEAAHNLGREVSSGRVERARRFGLESPLLAMPTVPMWGDLWRAKVAQSASLEIYDPVQAMKSVASELLSGTMGKSNAWGSFLACLGIVIVVLAFMALLTSFRQPPLLPPRWGKPGWLLGVLVPGAARQYWVFGPLVTAFFFYLVLGALILASSEGASSNILDAIAVPDFTRYYGAGAPVPDPTKQALDGICSWYWLAAVLAGNLVFVAVAEKLAPDPAGFFVRKKS